MDAVSSSPVCRLCPPRLTGDVGYGGGKLYSVNVPLMEGMDDDSYKYVFEPVMQKVRGIVLWVVW